MFLKELEKGKGVVIKKISLTVWKVSFKEI